MGILSKDTIGYIERQARSSLLNVPGVIGKISKSPLDIYSISPKHKLIFIEGNNQTGLEHINIRHRFFSDEYTRHKGEYIITSRFPIHSGTLFDFRGIVDELFNEKNKVLESVGRSKNYDAYLGRVRFMANQEFRLVLHKGTKIIHTLYPNILPEQKPKGKRFLRHECTIEHQDEDYARIVIPYTDIKDRLAFGIGVRLFRDHNKEKWTLLIYKNSNLVRKADNIADSAFGKYHQSITKRIELINRLDLMELEDRILEFMSQE